MKARYALLLSLPLLVAATGFTQTGAVQSNTVNDGAALRADAPITGVWRGEADGAPFVTMTVSSVDGKLTGAIVFYLHIRQPDGSVRSTEAVPEPLLRAHLEGTTLLFDVSHRWAHSPKPLPPPVHFKLQASGRDRAQLVNLGSPTTAAEMVRSEY
jgi:hypothetical protein